jgi:hypothetical protein
MVQNQNVWQVTVIVIHNHFVINEKFLEIEENFLFVQNTFNILFDFSNELWILF